MVDLFSIKRPIIKSKNFCPNPVAKYGIPAYADSFINPKVIGTPAWQKWWEEQIYYIFNGYETGGIWIPGRYYYFLNFFRTKSVRGLGPEFPEYLDYQLEYAYLIEEAKRIGWNVVVPKGRRKGLSVMTVGMCVDYGWRFMPSYNAGIAAGIKDYTDDFVDKWKFNNSLVNNEFSMHTLTKTYDDIIAGWQEKNELTNMWEDKGTMNTIYSRTMHDDPQVFKGKFLNDVVFEESGEFDNLLATIAATIACLQWGHRQLGTMFIYGTGGNIKRGSKGFETVWHHAEDYKCLRYYVSGSKFYPPYVAGSKDEKGKLIEEIPNLLKFKPHERVGMEDEVRANEVIAETKKMLLKSGNLKKYWEYCKDYPGDLKEVFRVAASNHFPQAELNDQAYIIESNDLKYLGYRLEWKKNEKGEPLIPRQVETFPIMKDENQDEAVWILHNGHPKANVRNLFVGGGDSYDQDKSDTSKSLGALVVLSKEHGLGDYPKMTPVCLIRTRPSRREKFYDMCMMVSCYYNLLENTLFDVAKPAVIKHYKDCGMERYLAKRPQKYESEGSKQTHDFGVALTIHSKPLMVGLLQTYYRDYSQNIWFRDMIDEALRYDELEVDSDNDTVDALGIALMQMYTEGNGYHDTSEMEKEKPFQYPEWGEDGHGNIVDVNWQTRSQTKYKEGIVPDPFIQMIERGEIGRRIVPDDDDE